MVGMQIAAALETYLREQGVDTLDTWYRMPIFGRRVPLFRVRGRLKEALTTHDVHHLITGFDTGLKGECELCAWELASGGCHTYVSFWLDRLLFAPIAILCAPIRFVRAFWSGLGARNAYPVDKTQLLAMDVDEVRRLVGVMPGPASPPRSPGS